VINRDHDEDISDFADIFLAVLCIYSARQYKILLYEETYYYYHHHRGAVQMSFASVSSPTNELYIQVRIPMD
uniref:Uncharacterized protein n=1 Tax=Magallana gigas TaxID=29159 RepID=A0A8W8IYT3_MAGGI